jgi:hypothetical protein
MMCDLQDSFNSWSLTEAEALLGYLQSSHIWIVRRFGENILRGISY